MFPKCNNISWWFKSEALPSQIISPTWTLPTPASSCLHPAPFEAQQGSILCQQGHPLCQWPGKCIACRNVNQAKREEESIALFDITQQTITHLNMNHICNVTTTRNYGIMSNSKCAHCCTSNVWYMWRCRAVNGPVLGMEKPKYWIGPAQLVHKSKPTPLTALVECVAHWSRPSKLTISSFTEYSQSSSICKILTLQSAASKYRSWYDNVLE